MSKVTVALFAVLFVAGVAKADDTASTTTTTTTKHSHSMRKMDCSKMTGDKQKACQDKMDQMNADTASKMDNNSAQKTESSTTDSTSETH